MKVLITGGAGYIGSNTALKFLQKNFDVTIIDNLSTGSKDLIPKKATFLKSDISDENKIQKLFNKNNFDIVIHLAAFTRVGESVKYPKKYFHNNYQKSKIFFNLCAKNKINKIIFSSTGSVYGNVDKKNILEDEITSPINPYSKSKVMVEEYLKEFKKKKINVCILRYFNVAGADFLLRSGLKSNPDNLIKAICEYVTGKKKEMIVNGNNFNTKDGTTIRDYIHVTDLAEMHYIVAKYLIKMRKKSIFEIFNCGYGRGFSVLDIICEIEKIIKKKIKYKIGPARKGDVSISVANSDKFKKKFNWLPKYNSLKIILKSALIWEKYNKKK